MTLAIIRSVVSTKTTECTRCTRPLAPRTHHWIVAGHRVGPCCIRPDERPNP